METSYENENDFTGRTYTITIDPTPQYIKPDKDDDYAMGIISNSISLRTGITINEFAKYVSQPFAYTWFGGTLNGSICDKAWADQSLFAIDIDDGLISMDDAIERLQNLGLKPQVSYISLSSSEELHKFRIVLFVDQPVKEVYLRNLITEGLLALFPEGDKSCKNPGRFYFGGKESYVKGHSPISVMDLFAMCCNEIVTKDNGYTRKLKEILESCSPADFAAKCALLYNNYRSMQIPADEYISKRTYLKGERLKIIDWKVAYTEVRILREFLNGTWLFYEELYGLATNLIHIDGGVKLMKETMEKFNAKGITNYPKKHFRLLTTLKAMIYPPKPIYLFSRYEEDADLCDLISAVTKKRGLIQVLETIHRVPLKEAEVTFKSEFEKVIKDQTKGKIHLFAVPTAIGKTEFITSLSGVTIAATTNALKSDITKRMKNIDCVTTPENVIFESEQLRSKIDHFYTIGLPTEAAKILHSVATKKNERIYSEADVAKAKAYVEQLEKAYHTHNTVLTTHSRGIHSEFSHDTIIFDEDPLKSLIDIKTLKITDLMKLACQSGFLRKDFTNLINELGASNPGEIKTTPVLNFEIEGLIERAILAKIDTNIFDFFNSSFFIRDCMDLDVIHYVVRRELPTNKKIIILSATLPIFIYEKLFGERLNKIDIRDVESQGRVIQYTRRSCSRRSLKRYCESMSNIIGDTPVITFKSFSGKFKNPVESMYFHNCSGLDSIKGQDLAVVGTPHRNNVEYLLTAKVLGIDFEPSDTTMKYQMTEFNGFRFQFNCFDNPDLRFIQLTLVESELIQAIGRARTLRTDAKVEVYSNFPLRISNEFYFDKERNRVSTISR